MPRGRCRAAILKGTRGVDGDVDGRGDDFFGLCECLNDLFRSNGIGSFTMTVTYFVKIVFTVEERYRNSEFKVMETIYRNIIRSAMECNSGKSMSIRYEPTPDVDRFEFELHFEK